MSEETSKKKRVIYVLLLVSLWVTWLFTSPSIKPVESVKESKEKSSYENLELAFDDMNLEKEELQIKQKIKEEIKVEKETKPKEEKKSIAKVVEAKEKKEAKLETKVAEVQKEEKKKEEQKIVKVEEKKAALKQSELDDLLASTKKVLAEKNKVIVLPKSMTVENKTTEAKTVLRDRVNLKKTTIATKPITQKTEWKPKYIQDKIDNHKDTRKRLDGLIQSLDIVSFINDNEGNDVVVIKDKALNKIKFLKLGDEYFGLKVLSIANGEVTFGNSLLDRKYIKKISK